MVSTLQCFRDGGERGAIREQVKQLKEEIRAARTVQNRLGNQDMSREQLLTFDMLDRHPLVTDQVAYKFCWDQVDALYEFVYRLPAWIMDDDIMDIWKSGEEDNPRSFKGWEAKKAEWGQVLLMSWAPLRMSDGAASQTVKVFTAVVVCIHPCQAVMSIKDGASDLLNHAMASPTRSMSALC